MATYKIPRRVIIQKLEDFNKLQFDASKRLEMGKDKKKKKEKKMRRTYYLHVSLPSSKLEPTVIADAVKVESDRIIFYDGPNVVSSYPNQYTCICEVKNL